MIISTYVQENNQRIPKTQNSYLESATRAINKYYPEYRSIYEISMGILSLNIKPGMVLLDAGCGRGKSFSNIKDCLPNNLTIIGVDDDKDALSQNHLCNELYVSNLESLSFPNSTFDFVTSFYVIEHLKYPDKVISEMARVLKTSGFMLVVLPNLYNPLMLLSKYTPFTMHKLFHKIFSYNDRPYPTYFKCNNLNSLDNTMSKLGLKRQSTYYNGCWRLVGTKVSLIYPWIIYDKLTNINFLKATKADICVLYQKI